MGDGVAKVKEILNPENMLLEKRPGTKYINRAPVDRDTMTPCAWVKKCTKVINCGTGSKYRPQENIQYAYQHLHQKRQNNGGVWEYACYYCFRFSGGAYQRRGFDKNYWSYWELRNDTWKCIKPYV